MVHLVSQEMQLPQFASILRSPSKLRHVEIFPQGVQGVKYSLQSQYKKEYSVVGAYTISSDDSI